MIKAKICYDANEDTDLANELLKPFKANLYKVKYTTKSINGREHTIVYVQPKRKPKNMGNIP